MKIHCNQIKNEFILTKQTYGAIVKKGIVYDLTHNCKREAEPYTLIRVIGFNFFTHKVVIECIKGMDQYNAEVTVDFISTHCDIKTPDQNQEVEAVMVEHVSHDLLDKDTAIFIIVMALTYIVGLVLGKGI